MADELTPQRLDNLESNALRFCSDAYHGVRLPHEYRDETLLALVGLIPDLIGEIRRHRADVDAAITWLRAGLHSIPPTLEAYRG